MDVLQRIERGEIPKHDVSNVVLTHKDFTELLRLARLGAAKQWIPVSERLPKEEQTVDILVKDIGISDKSFRATNFKYVCAFPIWVTHWMPLPEPPKEGNS